MPRHSQNQTDRMFFTRAELQRPGWGEFKERLQGYSLLYFAQCPLSLKGARTPVCTPDGLIYEKEFILKHLLKQKNELADKRKAWELQEQRKQQAAAQEVKAAKDRELEAFHDTEMGVSMGDHKERGMAAPPSDKESKPARAFGRHQFTTEFKSMTAESRYKETGGSFWVSGVPGMADAKELTKPDMATRCPISNAKLRVKDLVALDIDLSGQDVDGPGMFACASTKKPITHQQAYALKPSGKVFLEQAFERLVKPEMKCPLTGKRIGKGDVIKLKTGGTGFAAHNELNVTGYVEGNNFSCESFSRNLQGSCGGTGFTW